MRRLALFSLSASSILLSVAAHAEAPTDKPGDTPREMDAAKPRVTAEERPFVYLSDPSTPGAGNASIGYVFGLGSGVSADRPLPAKPGNAEFVHAISLGYGVTSTLSPFVSAAAGKDGTSTSVGARYQLTDPSSPFRLTVSGALMRESGGAFGGVTRLSTSWDAGRVRLAGNLHLEKVFGAGRDRLDVLALAGVSFRVLDGLRLGAEYVGQDLEDAFEREEAEGGAKHYLGPNAAIDLDRGRVQLTFGPAFGLDARSPRFLGRVAMLVSF